MCREKMRRDALLKIRRLHFDIVPVNLQGSHSLGVRSLTDAAPLKNKGPLKPILKDSLHERKKNHEEKRKQQWDGSQPPPGVGGLDPPPAPIMNRQRTEAAPMKGTVPGFQEHDPIPMTYWEKKKITDQKPPTPDAEEVAMSRFLKDTRMKQAPQVSRPCYEWQQYLAGASDWGKILDPSKLIYSNAKPQDTIAVVDPMLAYVATAQTVERACKRHIKELLPQEQFFSTLRDFPADFFSFWGMPQHDDHAQKWGHSDWSFAAKMDVVPMCCGHHGVPLEIVGIVMAQRDDFIRKVICWTANAGVVARVTSERMFEKYDKIAKPLGFGKSWDESVIPGQKEHRKEVREKIRTAESLIAQKFQGDGNTNENVGFGSSLRSLSRAAGAEDMIAGANAAAADDFVRMVGG